MKHTLAAILLVAGFFISPQSGSALPPAPSPVPKFCPSIAGEKLTRLKKRLPEAGLVVVLRHGAKQADTAAAAGLTCEAAEEHLTNQGVIETMQIGAALKSGNWNVDFSPACRTEETARLVAPLGAQLKPLDTLYDGAKPLSAIVDGVSSEDLQSRHVLLVTHSTKMRQLQIDNRSLPVRDKEDFGLAVVFDSQLEGSTGLSHKFLGCLRPADWLKVLPSSTGAAKAQ